MGTKIISIISAMLILSILSLLFAYFNKPRIDKKKIAKARLNEKTQQVWVTYMGMKLPFYEYELPMWKSLPPQDKKDWVKKLKEDIRLGKKSIVQNSMGEIIGYEVKDKATILKENTKISLLKKQLGL